MHRARAADQPSSCGRARRARLPARRRRQSQCCSSIPPPSMTPALYANRAVSASGAARSLAGRLEPMKPDDLSGVYLVEDGDAAAFSWGPDGARHSFRGVEDGERALRKAVAHGLAVEEIAKMSEFERAVARELSVGVGVRKDTSGAVIIGYFPFDGNGDEDDAFASQLSQLVSGSGRFVGPEDQDVIVALVDVPELGRLRHQIKDQLLCYGALPYTAQCFQEEHGYLPHFTIAYVSKSAASPSQLTEVVPFTLDSLALAAGPKRVQFDFSGGYDVATSDPAPYYAARLQKEGRVLRQEHLEWMEDSIARMQEIVDRERRRKKPGNPESKEDDSTGDAAATGGSAAQMSRDADGTEDLAYTVTKALEEERFTLGPLYAPERKDAHGEWTDAATLQKAVWSFVEESAANGRLLNLQHGDHGTQTVGEWVEVMAWPYEHTIKVATAGGEERELEMPAGTVYLGAKWSP